MTFKLFILLLRIYQKETADIMTTLAKGTIVTSVMRDVA